MSKDRSTGMMAVHVLTWMGVIFMIGVALLRNTGIDEFAWAWPITAGVCHFMIEWPLARWADSLYHKNNIHGFIVVSIFECFLTGMTLILLFELFLNRGIGF